MSKASLFVPLGIFLILMVILGLGFGLEDPHLLPSALIHEPMPSFELTVLDEGERVVTEADIKGQVSLLNVWATWCPSCVVEHDQLLRIATEFSTRIIGINYNDDVVKARKWLERYENPYQFSIADTKGTLGIDLGVYGAPETFVVDAGGIIRYRHVGVITAEIWDQQLGPLVASLQAASRQVEGTQP